MEQRARLGFALQLFLLIFFAGNAFGESLSDQVRSLKSEVVNLNRELYELEQALVHPADTQVSVFLSLSDDLTFDLDSVELQIDGKMATSHLYNESELTALKRGGIQRLYVGNLSSGKHTITAVLNGLGNSDRYFRRQKVYTLQKGTKRKLVEFRILQTKRGEPTFSVKEWD